MGNGNNHKVTLSMSFRVITYGKDNALEEGRKIMKQLLTSPDFNEYDFLDDLDFKVEEE